MRGMRHVFDSAVPDQSSKTALITGGNSGIGWQAAAMLMRAGAHVVLACRDEDRANDAVQRLHALGARGGAQVLRVDLASLASIREAVARFSERNPRLDVLINNAGVMAIPRLVTSDGFEMQIGVNHFGHFALTGCLLEAKLLASRSRIVTVSSMAHWVGRMRWDDMDWTRSYDRWGAYAQSKLANLLFAYELGRRLRASGSQASSVACHPGYASTNLAFVGPALRASRAGTLLHRLGYALFAQSAEGGALPTVHAATAAAVQSGDFIGPGGIGELRGPPAKVKASAAARDVEAAARLWQISVERTGVAFSALEPPVAAEHAPN
jgi:NAD(P)-dependent dehydrogenase (short-subunit alcohol dehydrogenase family)